MAIIKRYLIRYARDIIAFGKAFGLACLGVLPIVLIYAGVYAPFVYFFVAGHGFGSILVFGLLTGIFDSYRYKFSIFFGVVAYYSYILRETLNPAVALPGINPNLLIFSQLLFLFAAAYYFLERHRIGQHLTNFTGYSKFEE